MMSTSLIVPLEIAKLVFFALYVAATVGVIVGVIWEGEQYPKEKQQRGWRLLVKSLALDTFFTVMVFGTDGWVSAIQRSEIIALEEKLAPRALSKEQLAAVEARAKLFPGQEFEVSVSAGTEAIDLSCVLSDALVRAGWHRIDPAISITVGTQCGAAAITLNSGLSFLVGPSETADPAAIALSDALTKVGLPCHPSRDIKTEPRLNRLMLIVGAKP